MTRTEKDSMKIKLSPEELRAICGQFDFDRERDMMGDERLYKAREILSRLEKSDFIIFCLYLEMGSERKVADILGVSRTPIHRLLTEIRSKIERMK